MPSGAPGSRAGLGYLCHDDLAASQARPVRAGEALPVEIDGDGIVVSATVDGAPARFVIDTGSTHSIVRPRGAPGRASLHTLGVGADRLAAFELVEIDAGPPEVDGMLGRSFFEARRVLVDLAGKRMWIQPGR